jgi:hypothetical protein
MEGALQRAGYNTGYGNQGRSYVTGVTTPKVKNRTFRTVAKTCRHPEAKCNTFLQREIQAFSVESRFVAKTFVCASRKTGFSSPIIPNFRQCGISGLIFSNRSSFAGIVGFACVPLGYL